MAASAATIARHMGRRVASIPRLGLGTWMSPVGEAGAAVRYAIEEAGYEHVDCAPVYGNEPEIGEMAFSRLTPSKRAGLHITSKLWLTEQRPENVRGACEQTLRDLQLDYLDLFLVHWPVALSRDSPGKGSMSLAGKMGIFELRPQDFEDVSIAETWEAMGELVDAGLVRGLGLSNCSIPKIQEVMEARGKPVANLQVEMHPRLQQPKLLEFCAANDITVTAYSPLGSPGLPDNLAPHLASAAPLLEDETLKDIAAAHGVSTAQVCLQWAMQRGTITIPKSVTPARIDANRCLEFAEAGLSEEDMARITAMDRHERTLLGRFYLRPGQTIPEMWGHDGTVDPLDA